MPRKRTVAKKQPDRILRVYVAGPYSASNVISVLENMREGMRWATKVFLAGHAPFAPWLDYHYSLMLRDNERITIGQYYDYSLAWLRASDVLFLTPGWERSAGCMAEKYEAEKLGILIVYSLEELTYVRGDIGAA